MITKEERNADKAILAAATGGTWATYSPRSQAGGPTLGCFGTTVDTPDVLVQIRQLRAEPVTDADFAALVQESRAMSWEQHAANAKAAAHAVNRLPAYIEAAAEMERRVLAAEAAHTEALQTEDEESALPEGMLRVLRILRGGQ